MYAAAQVPSGVLISTLVSVTGNSAADAEPAAETMPAATDIATKSRRERSPEGSVFSLWSSFSSVITFSPWYSRLPSCLTLPTRIYRAPDRQRNGESVHLAFDRLDGSRPERAIAFLHGILGRGINLRTIARRFVEARPGWTAWLVDLRGHGRSPKGAPNPSLETAARDVLNLAAQADLPLAALVGHSFGGKVA